MTKQGYSSSISAIAGAMLALCLSFLQSGVAQSQVVINNGADVIVKAGAPVIIKTQVRNSGYLANESRLVIEGQLTNNDSIEGVGIDTFEVHGNWMNNGVFIAGESLALLAAANQTIGGSLPITFYDLALEGTGIKALSVDATVSNKLFLNALEMSTGVKKLTVSSADTNAIERTLGFISSEKGGFLERHMDNFGRYLFPLGSSDGTLRYRPVTMSPADSGTVAMGARLANAGATSENYDLSARSSNVYDINPLYYHQLRRTQGTLPIDITLHYNSSEDGIWTQLAQWQAVAEWDLAGYASWDAGFPFNSITLSNHTNFDSIPFALMNPVPLLDSTKTVVTNVACNSANNGSICVSDTLLAGTPPIQFLWSNGESTSCITGLAVGVYTLTVIDSFGASNIYTFTINQPNNIIVEDTVEDVSCKGSSDGSICLSITGDFPPFTYNWLTGPGDSCLTNLEAAFYSVTVTDSTGCTIVLPNIAVGEPDLLVVTAQAVEVTCYGFANGQGIASSTGGTEPYTYHWVSEDGDTSDIGEGFSPGTYQVIATDINGCTATTSIIVTQPDSLIVTAGPDKTIFTGFTSPIEVISVTGGKGEVTYAWDPSNSVDNPDLPATLATPPQTTDYAIAVTDENGCIATDIQRIQVDVNLYTFPEAFLPNGSNVKNQLYKPEISSTAQLLKLQIFNRWGQLVSDNPTGWDGNHQGKLQPMDTYVYQAVIQLPDGSQKNERGDFILIR